MVSIISPRPSVSDGCRRNAMVDDDSRRADPRERDGALPDIDVHRATLGRGPASDPQDDGPRDPYENTRECDPRSSRICRRPFSSVESGKTFDPIDINRAKKRSDDGDKVSSFFQ